MSDEFEMIFPAIELQEAVKGDRRQQLEAIRDYIARQLEIHLCDRCLASRLRTGDQASLILRLTSVLEELDKLPVHSAEVSDLTEIRNRRPLGSKSSPRQQGGRKKSS